MKISLAVFLLCVNLVHSGEIDIIYKNDHRKKIYINDSIEIGSALSKSDYRGVRLPVNISVLENGQWTTHRMSEIIELSWQGNPISVDDGALLVCDGILRSADKEFAEKVRTRQLDKLQDRISDERAPMPKSALDNDLKNPLRGRAETTSQPSFTRMGFAGLFFLFLIGIAFMVKILKNRKT